VAAKFVSERNIKFLLYEVFDLESLTKYEYYSEHNRKMFGMVLKAAVKLGKDLLFPIFEEMDRHQPELVNGEVKVHSSVKTIMKEFGEGGWIASRVPFDQDGEQLPNMVADICEFIFAAANYSANAYPSLTFGASHLIESFGSKELYDRYVPKMRSGEWQGTMALTEPEAGSDLGALTTSAAKNEDGTYSISGNKIFISSGEHDLAENIIHPVLARIEGAPEGTAGISLFIVPKIWVNEDGSLGEPNDVVCTGVEEKMGIHGNATCSMSLGSKGKCRGMLLGEENKGMRNMFLMMNEARLLVGIQAFACASAAYMYAINYARQRVQGRHLLNMMDKSAPSVPIIQHPDVRRMLLTMKVYVEGMRSLLYYVGMCDDRIDVAENEEEKIKFKGIIDLLIPLAKGYVSDRAFDVCNLGVQVYGGYGYIKEYPMEQLLRDCRITPIYEGTNGIQAMDLLGRKLGLNKGKPIMDLMGEIQITIAAARKHAKIEASAGKVEAALNKLGEVALHLGKMAMSAKVMTAFAHAYPFMEVCGDVVMSWLLLWRATIAAEKLESGAKKKDTAFYEGQLKSAEFFVHCVLPVTLGKMDAILATNSAVVDIAEDSFGGK